MGKFSEDSLLREVLENEESREIAEKHLGDLLKRPGVVTAKSKTLKELKKMIPMPSIKKKFDSIIEELTTL